MRVRWAVLIIGLLGVLVADPAWARHKYRTARHCIGQAAPAPTVYGFLFNPAPQPNGCAPPVFVNGQYVGQDPDPFIRQQLLRDPRTGYYPY